jgi:hypothetical protein
VRIFLGVLFFSLIARAAIDVAFIEVRNYKGEVVRLEPEGRYAHVAISFRGYWLHAHPLRGVELVTAVALEKIGQIKSIVRVDEERELHFEQIILFLGKPYDSEYSWEDDRIYCSELVAKLLLIPPMPMNFKSEVWPGHYKKWQGRSGISPDDLFRQFKAQGLNFWSAPLSCEGLWR